MFKFYRVKAYLLRHLYEIIATIDRKVDIFFWPTIDLLTFGLLTVYINKLNLQVGFAGAIIGALILWTLVYNIQRDISVSFLEEAWSRNIFNLFSTPIRVSEIVLGTLILSVLKAILTIVFVTVLAFGLFGFNLLEYGPVIIFYILNIFVFGWAFGYLTAGLIFRYGTRIQTVAWSLIAVIYPISGVFYPLETLPKFLSTLARGLPISYVFEGLRGLILNGRVMGTSIFTVIVFLNVVYLLLGIRVFLWGFHHAKERGWFIHPV